jgi:hypothetical protein
MGKGRLSPRNFLPEARKIFEARLSRAKFGDFSAPKQARKKTPASNPEKQAANRFRTSGGNLED